jgi:very-short-patch-repair endonuclease
MPGSPRSPSAERDVAVEISPQRHVRPTDLEIQRFASRQHGVVTAAQLEGLGLGGRGIRHRAAAGRLRRLHRGVYGVEHPRREGIWMAAVLACGPRAVLSHRSAGALWGMDPGSKAIHVTVPHGQSRPRPAIATHRAALSADDITTCDGVPCTTPARTLVDLAGIVDRRALDRAEELRLFDLRAVRAQLERMRGQRGAGALAAALRSFDGPDRTRSGAERRMLTLLRRAGLPEPEVNVWIPLPEGGGYRPDLLWRHRRLIVEVDGRTHHARRAAFEHDRRRDRRLARLGYETRRYAAREVTDTPREVVSELATFLHPNRA